jgi:hypothetical protein
MRITLNEKLSAFLLKSYFLAVLIIFLGVRCRGLQCVASIYFLDTCRLYCPLRLMEASCSKE